MFVPFGNTWVSICFPFWFAYFFFVTHVVRFISHTFSGSFCRFDFWNRIRRVVSGRCSTFHRLGLQAGRYFAVIRRGMSGKQWHSNDHSCFRVSNCLPFGIFFVIATPFTLMKLFFSLQKGRRRTGFRSLQDIIFMVFTHSRGNNSRSRRYRQCHHTIYFRHKTQS